MNQDRQPPSGAEADSGSLAAQREEQGRGSREVCQESIAIRSATRETPPAS